MSDPPFTRFRWLAIPLVLAVYFALIITSNGVPSLRHDWNWPDYYRPFLDAISGWDKEGIGSAGLFVNNYVLDVLLAPMGAVIGPHATLFVFAFGIGVAILLAARKLATTMGCPALAANAAAAFALFNPWVYTKIVAGHLPMIVAYAATMALLSEAMREKPRPEVCALAVAFTLPQLQFFLPALLVAVTLVIRAKMWLPVATWVVMGAPTLLGVAFRAKEFAATPLTLTWEQTQSVAPVSALLLSGYFAKYTLGFDKLGTVAVSMIVAVSIAGLVLTWRSRRVVAAGAATAIMLVVAMGLRGPAASAFAGVLATVPALALYRELYDVIAYVAIGYLVLCAAAATRHIVLLSMLCAAALILIISWTAFSPARQWANRGALPAIPHLASPLTRFALMPPFQPLRYGERFAGLDPDAIMRGESVVPINEEVPTWPEDVALARYQRTRDWRPLANLSVSEISNRPWYSSASRELSEQLALAPPQGTSDWERLPFSVTIPALPEVSLIPPPSAQPIPSAPGAGEVFFGDVAGLHGEGVPADWAGYERPRPVVPGNRFVHATDGWVDARLGFAVDPEIGQPFGGALTTSSSELLTLSAGDAALVFVRGALLSQDGSVLTTTSAAYRWIAIPSDVTRVRCHGLCVVALQGRVPSGLRSAPGAPALYTPVSTKQFAAWLLRTEVAAGPPAALRYNSRYDEHWLAWSASKSFIHLRLDGSVNGWLLPRRDVLASVWLVEWVALLQTIAQAIGALWLFVLIGMLRRTSASSG